MTNPQCIHIPDGSVVVSGELFDMACAAIAERDTLLADIERLTQREAKARAILEPMAECDAEIRSWLK